MDDPAASAAQRPVRRACAPETVVVETSRPGRVDGAPVNPPNDLSSTFVSSGDIETSSYAYARFDTPAWTRFEEALAELEHATLPGLVFGSGLAAIASVISLIPRGGTLNMPRHSYQGALASAAQIADPQGFALVTLDIADTGAVVAALDSARSTSAMLWIESPTNPMFEVADVPAPVSSSTR